MALATACGCVGLPLKIVVLAAEADDEQSCSSSETQQVVSALCGAAAKADTLDGRGQRTQPRRTRWEVDLSEDVFGTGRSDVKTSKAKCGVVELKLVSEKNFWGMKETWGEADAIIIANSRQYPMVKLRAMLEEAYGGEAWQAAIIWRENRHGESSDTLAEDIIRYMDIDACV